MRKSRLLGLLTKMLPFEPIQGSTKGRVMDAAALLRDAIVENLRSRQWRAGIAFRPNARSARSSASPRSTVRRVLAEFKRQGLITQTVGSGTYVSDEAPAMSPHWRRWPCARAPAVRRPSARPS